jgi:hypothetical protein
MITIFELKNKSFCRCFIRTPFYIKNFFILVALVLFLLVVYAVIFSREGVYVTSIAKILRGLNSETFNYLQDHRDSLRITEKLQTYSSDKLPSPQLFMTDCMRLSRPCIFDGLALNTNAVKKWGFGTKLEMSDVLPMLRGEETEVKADKPRAKPYGYLLEKIGQKEVRVYKDIEPEVGFGNPAYNSYKDSTFEHMKYKKFLKQMSKSAQGFTIKDDIFTIDKDLLNDLPMADFIEEFSDLLAVDFEQG